MEGRRREGRGRGREGRGRGREGEEVDGVEEGESEKGDMSLVKGHAHAVTQTQEYTVHKHILIHKHTYMHKTDT